MRRRPRGLRKIVVYRRRSPVEPNATLQIGNARHTWTVGRRIAVKAVYSWYVTVGELAPNVAAKKAATIFHYSDGKTVHAVRRKTTYGLDVACFASDARTIDKGVELILPRSMDSIVLRDGQTRIEGAAWEWMKGQSVAVLRVVNRSVELRVF